MHIRVLLLMMGISLGFQAFGSGDGNDLTESFLCGKELLSYQLSRDRGNLFSTKTLTLHLQAPQGSSIEEDVNDENKNPKKSSAPTTK